LRAGIGAFNITNLEEIEPFIGAAEAAHTPMIVQVTGPVCRFLGPEAVAAVFHARAREAAVPVVLHLDHTTEVELVEQAVEAGFGSVMYDGSRLPYRENIARTRSVVERVRRLSADVTVEGELGTIGGKEDTPETEDGGRLCAPEDAAEFVGETGIDLFAPAIGTVHGFYKTADPRVDFDRVRAIAERLEAAGLATPLVVHGGTGLPGETVARLVSAGFCKVNISSVIKKTLLDTTFEYIAAHRTEYDPPRVDAEVRQAVLQCVREQIALLGTPEGDDFGTVDTRKE
jgi:ketose-bisphosphate aldolase